VSMSRFIQCSSIVSCDVPPPAVKYALSLHDALPILPARNWRNWFMSGACCARRNSARELQGHGWSAPFKSNIGNLAPRFETKFTDRKSTRLNSSHEWSSYAVFCLKKKKKDNVLRVCD